MKRVMLFLMAVALVFSATGCGNEVSEPSSDRKAAQKTEQMMQEAERQLGVPNIVNFQEKRVAKWLYELRDQTNLRTYTYYTDMHGDKHFLCNSIGYGLPYSAQYTNPTRTVDTYRAYGYLEQLPQPEPNGLWVPEGLSATWVLCADENGKPQPLYVEQEIMVSPFKLK